MMMMKGGGGEGILFPICIDTYIYTIPPFIGHKESLNGWMSMKIM